MKIKEEILKTYNKIAGNYDKEFCQKIYYFNELIFFLKQLPKKAKILDVGCGSGHVAKYLEQKGFMVTGIDFSGKMLQIAKKRCKKAKFIKTDIEKFYYGKEKWNGIIALFILIHLKKTNIKKVLNKFHKSLRKNGLLFLSMVKGRGEYFGPEPLNSKLKMFFRYTTKKEIQLFLKKARFQIIKLKEILLRTTHEKQVEFFIVARKQLKSSKK